MDVKFRIWLVAMLVASTGPLAAQSRLSMKVSPAIAFAPANLTMRATVAPDSRNRWLEIVADSEDYYRSSEIQLDGERAPRTTIVEFPSVPGGVYHVSATLKGTGGVELGYAEYAVTVVESEVSFR